MPCGATVRSVDGRDTPVGRQYDHRRQRRFQTAIEVGEALRVEHVDFVDKQDAMNVKIKK